jgi:predicted short-subunit dehydrogenase-like oxidoreductase (DUF2520 family)
LFSLDLNIAVIGAGKFAHSLVPALKKAGYKVTGIVSKNLQSAQTLASRYQIPFSSDKLKSLTKDFNIFFLAVPDSEIKKVAAKLSKLNLDFPSSLFIHVYGALNVLELESLRKKKASVASFHIMQTFPTKKVVDLKNSYAAIETSNKNAQKYLFDLSSKLKLKTLLFNKSKVYYHLGSFRF